MMNDIVTPKRDAHFFWTLFKSTFLISAFTVGGGFVIIPLLKGKYVDEYHWISDKDTLDMVAIAQSMPGVIAVNSAVILGYRMAGVLGTLVALVATVLPCLITLSIISYCYDFFIQNLYIKMILRGMQCGATASSSMSASTFSSSRERRSSSCRLPSSWRHSLPTYALMSISWHSSSSTASSASLSCATRSTTKGGTYHDISVTFLGIL